MAHVPRLICFCGSEMKNVETGCIVEAKLVDQENRPYWKASADRWQCINCNTQVLRMAKGPSAEPFEEDYGTRLPTDYDARIRG